MRCLRLFNNSSNLCFSFISLSSSSSTSRLSSLKSSTSFIWYAAYFFVVGFSLCVLVFMVMVEVFEVEVGLGVEDGLVDGVIDKYFFFFFGVYCGDKYWCK